MIIRKRDVLVRLLLQTPQCLAKARWRKVLKIEESVDRQGDSGYRTHDRTDGSQCRTDKDPDRTDKRQ